MELQKLTIEDKKLVKQCDNMFLKFLDSEGKYDDNYLKREKVNTFFNDLSKENILLLVAKEQETVLGFLYGWIETKKDSKLPIAHMTFLYVNEEYRNKKIATSLIDEFLNLIKEMNVEIIEVKCYEENEAAKKLYKKYGFKPIWSNYRTRI